MILIVVEIRQSVSGCCVQVTHAGASKALISAHLSLAGTSLPPLPHDATLLPTPVLAQAKEKFVFVHEHLSEPYSMAPLFAFIRINKLRICVHSSCLVQE